MPNPIYRVDAHCHVDLLPRWQDALHTLESEGRYTFSVTTTPKAWAVERRLVEGYKRVRVGAGLHPQLVAERMSEIGELERAIGESPFVGEVGLDGSAAHCKSLPDQRAVLLRVFSACSEIGGRVISLHSLRAADAVLDLAEKSRVHERNTLIFHWFTGSTASLRRALELGSLISVNADMLRTEKGRKCAEMAGVERTLTESDAPFTKAHTLVGGIPDIEPAIELLSSCWKVDASVAANHVARTADRIWGL